MSAERPAAPMVRVHLSASELRMIVDALFLKDELPLRDRLALRLRRIEDREKRFDGGKTVA